MKRLLYTGAQVELIAKALLMYVCISLSAFIFGFISPLSAAEDKPVAVQSLKGDPTKPKSIFVFLDGTRNDSQSGTNVWRLYQLLSKNNDLQTTAMYIEGVGSVDQPLFGAALGRGMEKRILRGYKFIAENYNSGDDVYIFGFSRGAHEARSLAGFLAYVGVPRVSDGNLTHLSSIGNRLLELTKEKRDKDYLKKWTSWQPGQAPLLAAEIKDKLKLEMRPAEIKFLGVWDTVPGSSFKKYQACMEKIGFFKRHFSKMPIITKGERYKTASYPAIHQIVHAVSLDEKRSKFSPLLLCPAINPASTKLNEMWFPGAHADVGGGYQDSEELSGISLNWMIGLLAESYTFNPIPPQVKESADGVAHWSIGDSPANAGSNCEDRHPPAGAQIHKSFDVRKQASPVSIRIKGMVKSLSYPVECSSMQ